MPLSTIETNPTQFKVMEGYGATPSESGLSRTKFDEMEYLKWLGIHLQSISGY